MVPSSRAPVFSQAAHGVEEKQHVDPEEVDGGQQGEEPPGTEEGAQGTLEPPGPSSLWGGERARSRGGIREGGPFEPRTPAQQTPREGGKEGTTMGAVSDWRDSPRQKGETGNFHSVSERKRNVHEEPLFLGSPGWEGREGGRRWE